MNCGRTIWKDDWIFSQNSSGSKIQILPKIANQEKKTNKIKKKMCTKNTSTIQDQNQKFKFESSST
jgi:hypothetical protein